jgi:hypothetical protein
MGQRRRRRSIVCNGATAMGNRSNCSSKGALGQEQQNSVATGQ